MDSIDTDSVFRIMASIDYPVVLTDSVALDSSTFKLYFRTVYEEDFSSVDLKHDPASGYFIGEIPGANKSGVVHYYVEARDALGRRGTSPRAAPMAADSFYVRYRVSTDQTIVSVNAFELRQNYPNPFNASTRIEFILPKQSLLSLDVYDVRGRFVDNLMQGEVAAGRQSVTWDGKNSAGLDVPSGIYYARLQAPLLQVRLQRIIAELMQQLLRLLIRQTPNLTLSL